MWYAFRCWRRERKLAKLEERLARRRAELAGYRFSQYDNPWLHGEVAALEHRIKKLKEKSL